MMNLLLSLADHLIEFMGTVLIGALGIRWFAYKAALRDRAYFNTFSHSVEKILETEEPHGEVKEVEEWLAKLLDSVVDHLPSRSVRGERGLFGGKTGAQAGPAFRFAESGGVESLSEYSDGQRSVIHATKHQLDSFRSPFPPNFTEITYRVLGEDKHWKQVLGIPVEMLVRMMDILPGTFVVFGIFGTFIGIAAALPQIGALDLERIAESGPVLHNFIEAVSLSMRCSIAGIFCSIVMTVLNALYPIYSPRAEVRRNMERCFELMWHSVHGGKVSMADSKMIELLEKISGQLEQRASSVPGGFKKAS